MFRATREAVLAESQWKADKVEYIECWTGSAPDAPPIFRHGILQDEHILDWLEQKGSYAPNATNAARGALNGGFRLLICERPYYLPFSFCMSRDSFLAVEKKFHLHPATLGSFQNDVGTYSRFHEGGLNYPNQPERLWVISKAPQKNGIVNFGLSMCYDVSGNFTTALLHGEDIMNMSSTYVAYEDRSRSKAAQITELLRCNMHLCMHPLLIPSVMLISHYHRNEHFCLTKCTGSVIAVESELGVTRAGRRIEVNESEQPGSLSKTRTKDLTTQINTLLTTILFTARSPEWDLEFLKFLLQLLDDTPEYYAGMVEMNMELRESLEHYSALANGLLHHVGGLKYRLETQLNVLYSLVAQTDNRLSAQLAASAGRDSTAMKILAFITALFLPGTFVATLFSMSMFDWQGNSEVGEDRVVSGRFWIYWIVSIPLTIIVLGAWRLWWNYEKRAFDRALEQAIEGIDKLQSEANKNHWESADSTLAFARKHGLLQRIRKRAEKE